MPGDAPDFFMRGQIIERIDLIKDISRIGSIYDIVTRPNLVGNYSFETGILEPWFGTGVITDETAKLGEKSLKLAPGRLVEQILPTEIALNTVWYYYARSKSGTQSITFALMSDAVWESWTATVNTTWSPFRYEPTRNAKLVLIRISAPVTNTDDVYVDGILGVGWRRDVRVRETVNPPNLDTKLSTRASESSLTRTDVESETGIYSKRVDIRYDNVGLAKDTTLASDLGRVIKGDQGIIKQVSATDLRLDVKSEDSAVLAKLDNPTDPQTVQLLHEGSEIDPREISKIRDLSNRGFTLLANPTFDEDFTGWLKYGVVEIDETIVHQGSRSLKFLSGEGGWIWQKFGIALGVDWLKEFYLWLKANVADTVALGVRYYYTDETAEVETFTVSAVNIWEKKVLNPATGKYIETLNLFHDSTWLVDAWVDGIILVF